MTISNDGATIMKLLEIVHPAAKVLVDISASQDAEVLHSRRPFTVCIRLLDGTACDCPEMLHSPSRFRMGWM